MYIEASQPRRSGDYARLLYRFPSPSTSGCFSMYYHTYGRDLGHVRVELRTTGQKLEIWRNDKDVNLNRWQKVSMNIPPATTEVLGVRNLSGAHAYIDLYNINFIYC